MRTISRFNIGVLVIIAAITIGIILVTIFSLNRGLFEIFPYFYILPIILLAYIYPRYAVYFTIFLGWIYLSLVYIYGTFDIRLYAASSAWFYVFVSIGVIISTFSDKVIQERMFREIFENSLAGIFTYDSATKKILQINQQTTSMLGYQPAELKGLPLKTLWSDETDLQNFLKRISAEKKIDNIEVAFKKKDGEKIWAILTASPGSGSHIICSALDITGRKRAEAAVKESDTRTRMIGELIPFGVWMCDAKGRFTYLSDSFLSVLGITPEECRKTGWMHLLPGEDYDRTMTDWRQCIQTGSFWDYEYRIIDRKGKTHFVLSRGAPHLDESGQITSWIGIHLDITERKRNEERLEASLKEKEVIIKEVHHRVKNNMQVISGFLELQSNYISDPVSIEKMAECQQRVRTMALVHEKLYQSKNLGYINAAEYVKSLVSDLMNSYMLRTDIDFRTDVENINITLDMAIPCGLIINELVTNALKYAFRDRPGGNITVDLHPGPNHNFNLVVQDDGIGLPPGFTVDNSPTLGLQLVSVLARQLGGTIEVSSRNGARFAITFPEKF